MPSSIQRIQVIIAGVLSLLAMVGVARFAYTPLLPIMQDQANLSIVAGGWLAASNYFGYFVGAMVAASITNLSLKDSLYRLGMILAVTTTVAMGFTESVWLWSVLRFVSGLASACGLLIGSGLVMHWLISHDYRPELGIHFAGLGGGILLVSVFAEFVLDNLDWQQQWYAFSALALFLCIPAWLWLPRPNLTGRSQGGETLFDTPPSKAFFNLLMLAYFCAGVGFAVITTFIIAHINQLNPSIQDGNLTFLLLGLSAMPACFVWDRIVRHTGFVKALSWAFALQLIGAMLPLLHEAPIYAYAGAILFGGTFVGIVSMVLTMAGRFYPNKPAKMMGKMTLSYGAAQILAPALASVLGDWTGSYLSSFYLSAAILAIGLIAMLTIQWWVPVFADTRHNEGRHF